MRSQSPLTLQCENIRLTFSRFRFGNNQLISVLPNVIFQLNYHGDEQPLHNRFANIQAKYSLRHLKSSKIFLQVQPLNFTRRLGRLARTWWKNSSSKCQLSFYSFFSLSVV